MHEMEVRESSTQESLQYLPAELIDPDEWNARTRDGGAGLAHLADSIDVHGMLEPVRVRPSATRPGRYRAYAGYRRVQAEQELCRRDPARPGLLPCVITEEKSDADALLDSLAENLARQDLSPFEVGAALLRRHELGGVTQDELARAVALNPSYVRMLIAKARIARSSPEIREVDREKPLPARLLLNLPQEPEWLAKVAELWRGWGEENVDLLVRRVEQLRRADSVEIPGGAGATRLSRLQQSVRALQRLRDPALWELGELTRAEALEAQKLRLEVDGLQGLLPELLTSSAEGGGAHRGGADLTGDSR